MGYKYSKKLLDVADEVMRETNGVLPMVDSKGFKDLYTTFLKNSGIRLSPEKVRYLLYRAKRKLFGVSKGKKSLEQIYKESKFLLIIGDQVKGFPDDKEIKDFIERSVLIAREVLVYERKNFKIDYKISIK